MVSISHIFAANTVEFLKTKVGGYQIAPQVTDAEYQTPCIVVGCNNLVEISPQCGVFQGVLSIGIYTQIDEVSHPTTEHDAVSHDVLCGISTDLKSFFNSQDNGHLWGIVHSSLHTSIEDRFIVTVIEFEVSGQTLAV